MLRRISLIVVTKRLGIPLADVGIVFETLPADRMPSIRDWQRVSKLWRVQLEDQRKRIDRLEHELTGCIGCGCLSMKACFLLNTEDQLARKRSGSEPALNVFRLSPDSCA